MMWTALPKITQVDASSSPGLFRKPHPLLLDPRQNFYEVVPDTAFPTRGEGSLAPRAELTGVNSFVGP